MKVNENIYPYNLDVRKLPVHLTGIGGSEYQNHVIRMQGYHWHQILFCASGSGILKYDNDSEVIEAGDYFFLPAGYPHEYFSDNKKWDVRWVAFDGYAANHIVSQFNMTKPIIIKPQESSNLKNTYNKMFTAQKSDRMYGDYTCAGLIYDYIIEFHRHIDNKTNKLRNERNKLIMPVLNYMDKNFRTDFPLTVLAELVGISPQHLCRVFKETINMRPNEYLTQKRLQEAKRLLLKNELPVSEVAIQSGFPDAGYFSTVFKKHEGITPTEYKKYRM